MTTVKESLRKRMQEEHRKLRCAQEDLVEHFEEFCSFPDTTGLRKLKGLFDEFSASVTTHFEFEEVGGYMKTVVDRRPHHSVEVERLLDEHAEIRVTLDRLRTDLSRDLVDDAQALREFKRDFVELVRQFGRHEQAECELVMEVFWLEGGVGD